MADLFLVGQVGQEDPGRGEADVPASQGQGQGRRSRTGSEKAYQTGRLWPEGMPSFILSSWPGLTSVKSLLGLHCICVPASCLGPRKQTMEVFTSASFGIN